MSSSYPILLYEFFFLSAILSVRPLLWPRYCNKSELQELRRSGPKDFEAALRMGQLYEKQDCMSRKKKRSSIKKERKER
jgi:hypothetical protein